MRKLAYWLGIAALALQLGWPLLAGALPRSVALVPLCTVDGVTHYLEVPTGQSPLEHSSGHGDHCPLCFTGQASAALPQFNPVAFQDDRAVERIAPAPSALRTAVSLSHPARGPPLLRVVTSHVHELWSNDEKTLPARGDRPGTAHGRRLVRLGVLHDQH